MKAIFGWLRALLKFPQIAFMLLVGLLIAKTLIPWSGPHHSDRYHRVRNRFVKEWCRLTSRIIRLKIHRSGAPESLTQIWVANHISWIDILALASEHDLVFVAKHEISTWPILGAIFKSIGTLFIRRGNREATLAMVQRMKEALEGGASLMFFPEATTTNGAQVRRFGSKLFEPAADTQAQIQPIGLHYSGESQCVAPFLGEDTFLQHLLRVLMLKEIRLSIAYGAPVNPQSLTKEQLARHLRHSILVLLDQDLPVRRGELLQNRHNPFTSLSH